VRPVPAPRLPDPALAPDTRLRGSADRSTPGWQARLVDRVWTDQNKVRSLTCMQVAMGFEMRALLRAAADTRGMGTSAYVRRAVLAFAAADLGMDFEHVCQLAPPVRPDRSHGRRGKEPGTHGPGRDTGTGYGHWHVCGGCDD
jgi:hypothetical protein